MASLDSKALLNAIEEELDRLRKVRNLLAGDFADARVQRHAGQSQKRVLSAEARQRIVDAQKRRWAAQKQSAEASPVS